MGAASAVSAPLPWGREPYDPASARGRGIEYEPPEGDFFTVNGWLTGDGDYAGYTFFCQVDAFQYGGPTRTAHGVIFKGQPPIE